MDASAIAKVDICHPFKDDELTASSLVYRLMEVMFALLAPGAFASTYW